MKLSFNVAGKQGARTVNVDVSHCIVAGWAGRDMAAIEHHIEELAAIGVPRPSSVPLYYRIAANQLIQNEQVQVVGDGSSGEAEVFLFSHEGQSLVSLASDHTDRKLESHSVALSKQLCVKPVARDAWVYDDVRDHWDELMLRAWILEDGKQVLYQEGPLALLRKPDELVQGCFQSSAIPAGYGMTCGTVAAIGGIRCTSRVFIMELHDPKLGRSIRHQYTMEQLPEVA